jgi:hypothetical protein
MHTQPFKPDLGNSNVGKQIEMKGLPAGKPFLIGDKTSADYS